MDYKIYDETLIDYLKSHHTKKKFRTSNLPKFIFLCGKSIKEQDSNRDSIVNFYSSIGKSDVFCLFAENLWDIEVSEKIDLLSFEDILAELSDHIILFVESYGTACELGAFAMKESLVKKLIVIEFNSFKGQESFINDGPIKKILDNNASNILYVDDNAIFSNGNLDTCLRDVVKNKKAIINRDERNVNLNSFLIEMLELISLLGPIKKDDLIRVYKNIKGFTYFDFESIKNVKFSYILKLLTVSNLINEDSGYYSIKKREFSFIGFMFDMKEFTFYNFRAKYLSKKYKYKDGL